MLQDIRRKGLGKSGLKFRHGEGGYQKWPKKFRRLLWTAPWSVLSKHPDLMCTYLAMVCQSSELLWAAQIS